MTANADALFDCLFLADRMQGEDGRASIPEIHLFAYLGCLLWLYRHRTVTEWGYTFVGTEFGAPFSVDIDSGLTLLIDQGHVIRGESRITLSDQAKYYLETLVSLELNQERTECLAAACASTAVLSPGMVSSALSRDPELERARKVPITRSLLEEAAVSELYGQFSVIQQNLKLEYDDLRVPAVVWLSALQRLDTPVVER
jgi:hypothetical protein